MRTASVRVVFARSQPDSVDLDMKLSNVHIQVYLLLLSRWFGHYVAATPYAFGHEVVPGGSRQLFICTASQNGCDVNCSVWMRLRHSRPGQTITM